MIEETANVETGGGLAEEAEIVEAGGGAVGMAASRSWYLAVTHSSMLLWIYTSRARDSVGGPISHMGSELLYYPSLRCHIFKRNAFMEDDLVLPEWIR